MDSPGLAHAIKHAGAQVRIVFDTTGGPDVQVVGCQPARLVDDVLVPKRYYRGSFFVTKAVLRSQVLRRLISSRLMCEVELVRKYIGVPAWT